MKWAAFSAAYDKQLRSMAKAMLRRWRVPAAVTEDDVLQELRLGAWRASQEYCAGRGGMTVAAFMICAARLHAQRWVHEQRNAARRNGSAPGRFPEAASQIELDLDRAIEPGQHAAAVFMERLRAALQDCGSERERLALETLVQDGFDADRAATRLYSDAATRHAARLGSEAQAAAAVRQVFKLMEESA